MNNNLMDILNKSVSYLERKKVGSPRIKAETVLAEVLGMDRIMLYANFEKVLSEEELEAVRRKLNEVLNSYGNDDSRESEGRSKGMPSGKEEGAVASSGKNGTDIRTLIDKSIIYLEKNNVPEARLVTEIIFSHVLKMDRVLLFTRYRDEIGQAEADRIRSYIHKIGKEKFPLQYVLNEQEFYGRKFYVSKGVLIPRFDTEVLVSEAIRILKEEKPEFPKILDIGTGSGAIGITLALEIPESKVIGTDISDKALEISERNKEILNAGNIKFFKSDLFENVEYRKFDMIISNPPYIAGNETGVMSENVLLHEPEEALFAEDEGLFFYHEICSKGMEYLSNDGHILFEIGYRQGAAVREIMMRSGFKDVSIVKDMQGNERVVTGRKSDERGRI